MMLDNLQACSFLLGNADQLNYDNLYDACVTLLTAGCKCDKILGSKFSLLVSDYHLYKPLVSSVCVLTTVVLFQAASSVQYNFLICWRLLSCLAPSVAYMQVLDSGNLQLKDAYILHTLRCTPRFSHKSFSGWIKVQACHLTLGHLTLL